MSGIYEKQKIIYFSLCSLVLFLVLLSKIIFFSNFQYEIIDKDDSYIVEIAPVGKDEILIFYYSYEIEYLNIKSKESRIIKSASQVKSQRIAPSFSISDDYFICGWLEGFIADRRCNPVAFKKMNTENVELYNFGNILYISSNKLAVIFDEEYVNDFFGVGNIFYVDLKNEMNAISDGKICFLPFVEDCAAKNKLGKEDFDDILVIKNMINKGNAGIGYFFPMQNIIVSKKECVEIYDFKKKTTIFLPDFITLKGKKIQMKDLKLKSSLYSEFRSKSENTLITPMHCINGRGDFVTIWDTKNRKELITFDVTSGNYLNKGDFFDIIVSESGKFVAVLFKKHNKSFFSDYFDSNEIYFDVWDLEQKKLLNTFFVPYSEKSGSPVRIAWGTTDDKMMVWFNKDNKNGKILVYNLNYNIYR